MRYLGFGIVLLLLGFVVTFDKAHSQPAGYDERLRFDSSAFDSLLSQTIFVSGMSNRVAARRPRPEMGTRAVRGNRAVTRFEANRVFFHLLSDGGKDYVHQLRLSMQSLPDQVALINFHTDERLAFWLNLRNLVVFEAVMDRYPIARLDRFWNELYIDKRVTVAGEAMSIGDIEAHVKANWPSPYVMYAFYNGAVGGPNIRVRAFTRENVWGYLERNGREFIGSLRGLQFDDNVAEVSTLYETHGDLFPDFDADLRAHMIETANPILAERIRATDRFDTRVSDWYIADLYNGTFSSGSAAMVGPAALISAFGDDSGPASTDVLIGPPPEEGTTSLALGTNTAGVLDRGMELMRLQGHSARVQEFLRNWVMRNADPRRGTVSVEEVENSDMRVIPALDDDEETDDEEGGN